MTEPLPPAAPLAAAQAHAQADAGLGKAASAPTLPAPAPTPLQRLQAEPTRFSLDQATAVIAPGLDPTEVRYRSVTRLGAPGGEVTQAQPEQRTLVSPTFGLVGPGGVLPRHYTAWTEAESRRRSTALHAFLDLLARRFTGLYVKAGAKSLPTRNPAPAEAILAAAVGLNTPHLASALGTPLPAVLYHAGGLAMRSRSAERLRGLLCEETGSEVRIIEFAGGWVRLPPSEQSRLGAPGQPQRHVQLGTDAALGAQVWDASARFLVNLGPLSLRAFEALLPGAALHTRLVELTRLHVGLEEDFAFNPVLAADEVPPLRLGGAGSGAARLGWTSWLTAPKPRSRPAADAVLRPSAA